jgi:PAS domain S-box-containing protein
MPPTPTVAAAELDLEPEAPSETQNIPPRSLDDLALIAAHLACAPSAAIGVFEAGHLVLTGLHGLDERAEPAVKALCAKVIPATDAIVRVPDVTSDPRLRPHSPGVRHAGIRSLLGIPLTLADGTVGGALCILDREPRVENAELENRLRVLAKQVRCQIELQRTSAKLNRRASELRELFENPSVGIREVDRDGRIVAANTTELTLLGYTAQDYVGRNITEFHVDGPVATEVRRRLTAGEPLRSFPARLRHRDGSIRHVMIDSTAPSEPGLGARMRYFTRDVTGQRDTEERFRLLVENVRDYALFMLDPEGRVVSWNFGARRISGYESAEVVGRHFSIFLPSEDVKAGLPSLELDGARLHNRFEHEGWRVHKSGRQFWAHVVVTPIRESTGRLVGFAKVVRDLTDWKRTHDQLAESERRFRTMADSSAVLIWSLGPDQRCNYVNRPLLDFAGAPQDQVTGDGWLQLIHPDDRQRVYARFVSAADQRRSFTIEFRLRRRDGADRWMLASSHPMHDGTNAFLGFVCSSIDITARKEVTVRKTVPTSAG